MERKMYNQAQPNTLRNTLMVLLGILAHGCIESFVPETETFEDALVIEATITNEIKQQQVLLNRAFRLEDLVPEPETNAQVSIVDDHGNSYTFQETTPGKYVSVTDFGMEPGRTYQLLVSTSDGSEYESDPVLGLEPAPIHGLKASRTITDGTEGMEILVEYDNSQVSTFFRYKYEETYKIIAPSWTGQTLQYQGPELVVRPIPIEREERTCFSSTLSNDIILNRPQGSNAGNVQSFPVRFIDRNNYIISHRYSLLVKQLVISEESYGYLENLHESTSGEDIFSPSQPGFFKGNVRSRSNKDEKVLGFFHVASVTSQRIFFNYDDFFPNEELPQYVDHCFPFIPPMESLEGEPDIHELLARDAVRYFSTSLNGEFFVVPRVCADCTVLGSPTVPEFWEE